MIGANATISSRSTQRNQRAKLNADYQDLVRELSSSEITTVGCYILGRSIGEGTYGKVKLGTHRLTGQQVAIKRIEKQHTSLITREIHHHRRLHHPNIARLYEILPTETCIYVVTEYCSGGELYDALVDAQHFSERKVRIWFEQLCRAVAYCHGKKVVHRDLKLENILLDANNNIKVCDFGFTREVESKNMLDTFCGSAAYAAPEMILHKKYSGPEADIWSLGVILFTLLAGELPFDEENDAILKAKILNLEYTIPSYLSPESQELVQKILKIDPTERLSLDHILNHPWFSLDLPKDEEDDADADENENEEEISTGREQDARTSRNAFVAAGHPLDASAPIPIIGSVPRGFEELVEDDLNELTENLRRQREEIRHIDSERKRIISRGSISGASGPSTAPSSNRDSLIVPGSTVASPKTPSPSPPRFFGMHPLAGARSHFSSPTASPTFSPYRAEFGEDIPPPTPQLPPSATETRLMQALEIAGLDVDSMLRSVREEKCDQATGLWFLLLAKMKEREERDRETGVLRDSWGNDTSRIAMSPSTSSSGLRYSTGRSPLLQPISRGQHPLGNVMNMHDQDGSTGSLQRVANPAQASPAFIKVDAGTQTSPVSERTPPLMPMTPYREAYHRDEPPPSPTIAALKKLKFDKGFKSERSSSSSGSGSSGRRQRQQQQQQQQHEAAQHEMPQGSVERERNGWFTSMRAWFGTGKRGETGEGAYTDDEEEEYDGGKRGNKGRLPRLQGSNSGGHGGVAVSSRLAEQLKVSTPERQTTSLEVPRTQQRENDQQNMQIVGSCPPSTVAPQLINWGSAARRSSVEQRALDEAAAVAALQAGGGEITAMTPAIYRSLSFGSRRRSLQLMQGPPVSELDQFEYSREDVTGRQFRNIHGLSLNIGSEPDAGDTGIVGAVGRLDSLSAATNEDGSRPSSVRSSIATDRTSASSISSAIYGSAEGMKSTGYVPAPANPPATPPVAITNRKRSEDSFSPIAMMQPAAAASASASSTSSKGSQVTGAGIAKKESASQETRKKSDGGQGRSGTAAMRGGAGTATAQGGQPTRKSLTPSVGRPSLDKTKPVAPTTRPVTPAGGRSKEREKEGGSAPSTMASTNISATTAPGQAPKRKTTATTSTTTSAASIPPAATDPNHQRPLSHPSAIAHKERNPSSLNYITSSAPASAPLYRRSVSPPNKSQVSLSSAAPSARKSQRPASASSSSNSPARSTSPSPLYKSTTFGAVATIAAAASGKITSPTIPSPPSSADSSTSTSSTTSDNTGTTSSTPPLPLAVTSPSSSLTGSMFIPLIDKPVVPPAAAVLPQYAGRQKRISVAPAVTVGPMKANRGVRSKVIVEEEEEE